MRLALHIFKKDVRRFWWGIAIALLLQIAADSLDVAANTIVLPVPLDWLLMVAWAALVALAVHEDPLVGDRQFWITRPARWRVLLASKLLYALAVVHAPSFLADVVVLAARGFRPWEWLGSMLLKQVALVAVVTLPTIAMAAVLRNFAHLALAVIGIVGLTVFASNIVVGADDEVRTVLTAAVLGAGGLAVTWWQFARRRTSRTRLAGIATVAAAELVFVSLTPVFVARVYAAVDPAPARVSFHVSEVSIAWRDFAPYVRYSDTAAYVPVNVPLSVSGIPTEEQCLFGPALVYVIAPGGERMESRATYFTREMMIVQIPRSFYQRFGNAKVNLKGTVAAVLYRLGSTASLRVGERRPVPGMGRCSTELVAIPEIASGELHGFTQVECESPASPSLPGLAEFWSADLSHRTAQLEWRSAGLSPLARAMATFPLSPGEDPRPSGKFDITPEIPLGWQVVDLDFSGLRLQDYVLVQ